MIQSAHLPVTILIDERGSENLFDLCACPIALDERLEHETVLSYCISKIGWFDHETATKYGQHYGFFDVKGDLTPAGSVLANFIGVFGEAELAKLQQMKVKEGDMAFLKAA